MITVFKGERKANNSSDFINIKREIRHNAFEFESIIESKKFLEGRAEGRTTTQDNGGGGGPDNRGRGHTRMFSRKKASLDSSAPANLLSMDTGPAGANSGLASSPAAGGGRATSPLVPKSSRRGSQAPSDLAPLVADRVKVTVIKAEGLLAKDKGGTSDPFAEVTHRVAAHWLARIHSLSRTRAHTQRKKSLRRMEIGRQTERKLGSEG